jgi:hypothetical protein
MLYLLVGLVVVGLGYFIASPFLSTQMAADGTAVPHTADEDALLVQRDRLLRSLKDLEFDVSTGKFDEKEYQTLRAELAAQTSQVLDQIEARHASASATASVPGVLGATVSGATTDTELELEVLIARARKRSRGRWSCTSCSRTMNAADKFCASCGSARPDQAAGGSVSL